MSAAIAGLGGALLGGWRGKVGTEQFALLQGALPGLPLVLMAVVGGIAAVAGVLLGAMLFALMPLVGQTYPPLLNLMTVLPGLAGISLAANPNGIISQVVTRVGAARRRTDDGAAGGERNRFSALLVPDEVSFEPESIPVGAPAGDGDGERIDAELGMDWGRCHARP